MYTPQPPFGPNAPFRNPVPFVGAIDPSGHHPKLRMWFLLAAMSAAGLYLTGFGGIGAAIAIDDHDLSPVFAVSGAALAFVGGLLFYLRLGLGMYWLHGAWKWVPVDQRFDKNGKRYAPDGVFMLLIPYFHFYWMFVINLSLCDAMERMRYTAQTRESAPRDTAMWACILELIPLANFFVAPFFWASYMRRVDAMHDEIMSSAMTAGRT